MCSKEGSENEKQRADWLLGLIPVIVGAVIAYCGQVVSTSLSNRNQIAIESNKTAIEAENNRLRLLETFGKLIPELTDNQKLKERLLASLVVGFQDKNLSAYVSQTLAEEFLNSGDLLRANMLLSSIVYNADRSGYYRSYDYDRCLMTLISIEANNKRKNELIELLRFQQNLRLEAHKTFSAGERIPWDLTDVELAKVRSIVSARKIIHEKNELAGQGRK